MKQTFLCGLALVLAMPAAAQTEEDEVRAVVERMFEGMRQGDSTMVRATFDPSARLQRAGALNRQGAPVLSSTPIDRFVGFVGGLEPGHAVEPVWDYEIQIDGRLAQVWVKYEFIWQGNFSHCGVDAFQLWKSDDGWRIFQLTDTMRRDADSCWHQPEGQPGR